MVRYQLYTLVGLARLCKADLKAEAKVKVPKNNCFGLNEFLLYE